MATRRRTSLPEIDWTSVFGDPKKRPSQADISKARSKIDIGAAIDAALNTQSDQLSQADAFALNDKGGSTARGALDKILNAPNYSEAAKKRAKDFYQTGHGDLDPSILDTVKDVAGHVFPEIFRAIDIPKRAVVAGVDEALSAVDSQYDNDASWIENVFKKPKYGYGDVLQGEIDAHNNPYSRQLNNKFVKDTIGLTGDIALDPLTYAGVGLYKDIAEGSKALEGAGKAAEVGSKLKTAQSVEEGAAHIRQFRKALSEIAGKTAKKTLQVDRAQVLERAAELKRYDIIDKLSGARGVGRLTGKEAADLGFKGGLRFGQRGPTLVPWDLTRHLGAPFRGVADILEKTGISKPLTELFGSEERRALRSLIRDPSIAPERKADMILATKATDQGRLGQLVVTNAFGPELHTLATEVKHASIDHGVLGDALVNGDEAAIRQVEEKAPGLIEKFHAWKANMGTKINEGVGHHLVSDSFGDGFPVMFNDETRRFLKKNGAGGVWTRMGKNLDTLSPLEIARSAGGELSKVGKEAADEYGTESVPEQIQQIIARMGGPQQPFEDDIMKVMARDLYANGHALGEQRALASLRADGVLKISKEAAAGLEADAAKGGESLDEALQRLMATDTAAHKANDAAARGLDEAVKTYKSNLKVLRKEEASAEAAYDEARFGGAGPKELKATRQRMLEAGRAKLDAVKQLRLLQGQAGDVAPKLEARLGTVQAVPRRSLALTPGEAASKISDIPETVLGEAKGKVYATAQPVLDQSTEAVRILADPEQTARELSSRSDQVDLALDETSLRNVSRRELLVTAKESRARAADFNQYILDHPELPPAAKAALGLQVSAHEAAARLAEQGNKVVTDDEMLAFLESKLGQRTVSDMAGASLQQYGQDFEEADMAIVKAFVDSENVFRNPDDANAFYKFYRATTRGFKVSAMFTPGFSVRNSVGAYFNNYVAGIDTSSYLIFGHEFKKFYGGWIKAAGGQETQALERVSAEWRPIFAEMVDQGVFADTNRIIGEVNRNVEKDIGEGGLPRYASDNRWTRGARRINERVEQYHRGALMFDSLRKGDSFNNALNRVYKFHFNYSDLSNAETKIREVIPFYTWTSRNIPLQLEQAIRNPKMYQRFNEIKNNFSSDEKDKLVPAYIRESTVGIHLGAKVFGHKVDYISPDLPFNNADTTINDIAHLDQSVLGSSLAPLPRTLAETSLGTKFYQQIPLSNKLAPAPTVEAWAAKVPGVKQFMFDLKLARRGKRGELLMTDKNTYVIESFIPTFGRVRRLFPNEAKYNNKVFGAFVSFLGLGEHTVTASDHTTESYRKADALNALVDELKGQGIIPPSGQ